MSNFSAIIYQEILRRELDKALDLLNNTQHQVEDDDEDDMDIVDYMVQEMTNPQLEDDDEEDDEPIDLEDYEDEEDEEDEDDENHYILKK